MSRPYEEVRYKTEEEWKAARRLGIGGSEVGAVMGLNKWKSPLEVWLEKTGRAEPPDLSAKESVEWGSRLEPLIADKFAEMHPEYRIRRKNCTMVSAARPWARANIDREITGGGRGILEVKTAGSRSADEWVFGPPAHYEAQVQHYLSVTGWDFAWVAVLIGGQEYREYRVDRDEEDIAAIDAAVDSFWNDYVMNGVIPKMTGLGDEGGALASIHNDPSSEYVPVFDADLPELGERVELGIELNALSERRKLLDSVIKARIGDCRGIESESVRATWVRGRDGQDRGLRFSPARD